MKILITGSNGLLGQKIVDLIVARGHDQLSGTGLGPDRKDIDYAAYQYSTMDITDKQQVLDVIDKFQPDAVINTAAMTQVDECESEREKCWNLNVTAVENLCVAAKKYHFHLTHLSTDFIFDGKNGPYREEDKPNPISFYGESKLASEQVLLESSIEGAIVRTVLVYGIVPNMSRSNIILWVKKSLEDGKTLNIVDDQWRTPTLAEDLAEGCFLIAKQRAQGIFNISGQDLLTPYDMAIKTADFFHLDKSLINRTNGSKFQQKAKRPPKTGFILEKARNQLGYKPHSFDEGIEILSNQLDHL
ncbi:MAG TPA: SDR family oxidoreductase [Cyclobacteriaceae bacterium]